MAWSTSDRVSELPSNWPEIRRRVLGRAHYVCEWRDCSARANQCDHIEPGGPDEDWNLQALCATHHNRKSAAEGHAAKARLRKLLTRPPEESPGAIDPKDAVPRARKGW